MVNETGNRNRISEMCKFRIWFQLVHCGTITSATRYGFHQILHADQKCDRFYVWCLRDHKPEVDSRFYRCADSDFRCFGLWSAHFSTDRHQILHRVKTSSSAIAEGPRDALSQSKSCQLLHNCTKNHI